MMTLEHDGLAITIDDDGTIQLGDRELMRAREYAVARVLSNHQAEYEEAFKQFHSMLLEEQKRLFDKLKEAP